MNLAVEESFSEQVTFSKMHKLMREAILRLSCI